MGYIIERLRISFSRIRITLYRFF